MPDHVHPMLFGHCECTPEEMDNVDLIMRYRQALAADRKSYFAPGYRRHRPGLVHLEELVGVGGSGMIEESAFPDRSDVVIDVVARGQRVSAIWTFQGTHLGELSGVAATGARVTMWETGTWRIADGLITDSWFMADEAALLRAIGVLAD